MHAFLRRLPDPRRVAAFALGAALPLALAALVSVAFHGGLSDSPTRPAPVYPAR